MVSSLAAWWNVPPAVSDLEVSAVSTTALEVTFTGTGAYQARLAPADTGWWREPVLVESGDTITGLMPGTEYDVQVRANSGAAWSNTASDTTDVAASNRNGSTSVTPSGNSEIDGMLRGTKHTFSATPHVYTYSFPTSNAVYPYDDATTALFTGAFTDEMKATVRHHYKMLESYLPIRFQEITETSEVHANTRFGMSSDTGTGGSIAFAWWPDTTDSGQPQSDVWVINAGNFDNQIPGTYDWIELAHEIGHSLGLKHGHSTGLGGAGSFPAHSSDNDCVERTIMSYRNSPGASTNNIGHIETYGYPQTYMALDIQGLQYLYGANEDHCSGDTVHSWDETTGEYYVNDVLQWPAPGSNRVFQSVYDPDGDDTFDLSNFDAPDTSDLVSDGLVITDTDQLATLNSTPTIALANIHVAVLTDIENVET
jgi:hypothetical protein